MSRKILEILGNLGTLIATMFSRRTVTPFGAARIARDGDSSAVTEVRRVSRADVDARRRRCSRGASLRLDDERATASDHERRGRAIASDVDERGRAASTSDECCERLRGTAAGWRGTTGDQCGLNVAPCAPPPRPSAVLGRARPPPPAVGGAASVSVTSHN